MSQDSVSAWLLLPGGSTLNRTQAWLKSSPPGQVFAVMRLDDKKKVSDTNRLCTTRLMSLLKIRIQRMFEYLCIPDLRCLGLLCYVYYNIATFGLYSLQKLEIMNEYYE